MGQIRSSCLIQHMSWIEFISDVSKTLLSPYCHWGYWKIRETKWIVKSHIAVMVELEVISKCFLVHFMLLCNEQMYFSSLFFFFPFLSFLFFFLLFQSLGFPHGSVVKNPPASVGDVGSISASGRSPEGDSNLLWYYCQKNLMDRGAWWATVHAMGSQKSWIQLSN